MLDYIAEHLLVGFGACTHIALNSSIFLLFGPLFLYLILVDTPDGPSAICDNYDEAYESGDDVKRQGHETEGIASVDCA